MKRKIVVLQNDRAWNNYLLEAFEDTSSTPEIVTNTQDALNLIRKGNPDVVFVNPILLTRPLAAALQAHRISHADFRVFSLGKIESMPPPYPFDSEFEKIPSLHDFQKKLTEHLPLPSQIHLLVVDDNPEIATLFLDYFDHRTNPQFILEIASSGIEG